MGLHCAFWPTILNVEVACIWIGVTHRMPIIWCKKGEGQKMVEVEVGAKERGTDPRPPLCFANNIEYIQSCNNGNHRDCCDGDSIALVTLALMMILLENLFQIV